MWIVEGKIHFKSNFDCICIVCTLVYSFCRRDQNDAIRYTEEQKMSMIYHCALWRALKKYDFYYTLSVLNPLKLCKFFMDLNKVERTFKIFHFLSICELRMCDASKVTLHARPTYQNIEKKRKISEQIVVRCTNKNDKIMHWNSFQYLEQYLAHIN